MNIAIYGAGSLGTIMGAYLSQSAENVDLIDVNEEHINKLNENGATIKGSIEFHSKVNAITPDKINKKYDLVLLLTKQIYNNDVLPIIKNILNTDGILLSLQNGVPEHFISETILKEQIIAGSVEFGATYAEPGVSNLTTTYDTFKEYALQIGELNGVVTERIKNIKEVLEHIGGVFVSSNLIGTKWSKLLINSSFSGLSAACGCTYGDIMDDEVGIQSALYIISEGIQVAEKQGIEFEIMSGVDFTQFKIIDNIEKQTKKLKMIMEPNRKLEASMLQDLQKGRKTEIHYINGLVAQEGDNIDIPTPYNDKIVEIVSEAENKKTVPQFSESIAEFAKIIEQKKELLI